MPRGRPKAMTKRKRRCRKSGARRAWAVLILMQPDAASVDGWHTRERAIEYLHEYRADPKWAQYLKSMTIVERVTMRGSRATEG
jgi:hypothetical protein